MALEVNISKSQSEMDDQFVREYMAAVGAGGNFNEFLDDWGMSEEEVIDYLEANPQLLPEGFDSQYEGDIPEDGDDRDEWLNDKLVPISMNEDFVPDYSKTAEYEGEGITSELIPGESMAADTITWLAEKAGLPPEAGLAMAGIVRKNPKQVKEGVKGMFKGSKGSKVQVKPKDKFDNSKGSRHTVQRDTLGKDKAVTKTNKKKVAPNQRTAEKIAAGGLTTGLVLNRMLQGDRDVDGTLKTAPVIAPEEEIQGNQFGYHKREGQNFWTVNNEDPYWDTHEMGTGDAWSDADAKEVVQEVDWSSWFK